MKQEREPKPIKGYIAPENGLYMTVAEVEKAKAKLAETGPAPRPEQRPDPFSPDSLRKPTSQYIHT